MIENIQNAVPERVPANSFPVAGSHPECKPIGTQRSAFRDHRPDRPSSRTAPGLRGSCGLKPSAGPHQTMKVWTRSWRRTGSATPCPAVISEGAGELRRARPSPAAPNGTIASRVAIVAESATAPPRPQDCRWTRQSLCSAPKGRPAPPHLCSPTSRRGPLPCLAPTLLLSFCRITLRPARNHRIEESAMPAVQYRSQSLGGCRSLLPGGGAGRCARVILLLHGFPTSSHMFRDLIPALASRYRVIAPDLPGFGLTRAPPRNRFTYSFDSMADVLGGFVDALGLNRYALYVFDYGAPTGLRLAMEPPGADHGYHLPEWERLRRGFQLRMGSLGSLPARTDAGAPRGDAGFIQRGGDPVPA